MIMSFRNLSNLTQTLVVIVPLFLGACGGGGGGSSSSSDSSTESAQACSLIGLQEKSAKVINGVTCDNPIESSVVRVLRLSDDGQDVVGICTGTLVTPTQVVTATHCFPESAVYVVVAGDIGATVAANVESVSYAPGYTVGGEETGFRLFNDLAVVNLDRAISSPVMPILLSRSPVVGEPGYVYGYGRTVVGDGEDPSLGVTLQGGAMNIREVTPNHIFVAFEGDGVNVCNGDSGGPIVVEVNGEPALAGVTSEGSVTGCQAGDVTTFTNLQSDNTIAWLAQQIPSAQIR